MQSNPLYTIRLTAGGRKNGAKVSPAEFLHMQQHVQELKQLLGVNCVAVHEPLGMITARLSETEAAQLAADPRVDIIAEEKRYAAHAVQQNAGWALAALNGNSNGLYEYTTTGKGVTVYVVDTGFPLDDPDITGRTRRARFVTSARAPHGLQVAQLVGGSTYGVAKDATLVDVQISGSTEFSSTETLFAIDTIFQDKVNVPGPKVVNMSIGGPIDDFIDDAVLALIQDGLCVVVSAGNSGVDASQQSPARLSEAITVGALDKAGSPASFSNFGSVVDTWAPGVDVATAGGLFTGTSAAAPLVTGTVAKVLELAPDMTPVDIISVLSNPAKAELPALVTKLPKRPCRVRAWWMENGVKQYGPWTYLYEYAKFGILRSTAIQYETNIAVHPTQAPLVAGINPVVETADPTVIPLTMDPDELYAYSIQLSYQSGTFTYAGFLNPVPSVNTLVDVQGLVGCIKRVGPSLSRSAPGYEVEGRILPVFRSEVVSIRKPEGRYRVSDLVAEVATKAGTAVTFRGRDTTIKTFEFSGRFTEILSRLATEACSVLLQQNGKWFILPIDQSLGSFTVPSDDIISCKQSEQSDIFDDAIGLVSDYYDAYANMKAAKRLLDELLSTDLSTNTSYSTVVSKQAFTAVAFEFGTKNSSFRMLESTILIEDGEWDTWSDSARGPLAYYYQTFQNPERGCKNLSMAKLLVAVQEPSNASGMYFAKGTLSNLATPFWTGDKDNWGYITPTYRTIKVDGQDVCQMYLEFHILPMSWNQPNPNYVSDFTSTSVDDKRHYICDLELAYVPSTSVTRAFIGTIKKDSQVLYKSGVIIGLLPRAGGTVTSATGQVLWQYDSTNGTFKSQSGTLQASLVGNQIVGVNGVTYAQLGLADVYPVVTDSGQIIGTVSENSGVCDSSGELLGWYELPHWTAAIGTVLGNSRVHAIGAVFAGDTTTPRIVLALNAKAVSGDTLFDQVAADTLANDKLAAQTDLDINKTKVECIEAALTRLNIPLQGLRAAAEAYDAYYAAKSAEPVDVADVAAKDQAAKDAADAFLLTLGTVQSAITTTETIMLYRGSLPLPGNALQVGLTELRAQDCGIVESVTLGFSHGSCNITIVSKLWP